MLEKAIHTESIDEGLDRHHLTQLQKRFLKISSTRLMRTRSALGERQRCLLDALPLLFHVNHPMLPGYVSRTTPAGICRYEPRPQDLEAGRSIARSFRLQREPLKERDIEALYLMGSVGTVAHSEQSDLDLWVCHRPGLTQAQLEELSAKCADITAWAADMRLEVHFFLMNGEGFREGKMSTLNAESSGSAQRLLLLDEFYRSALHLAGRLPLWWFVPAAAESDYHRYAAALLHKRFLPADRVLDFGGAPTIPDGEFLGAGIWQLYKAIESPYKSVLKLLLLESYASQYPNIKPLSLVYKQKVYSGQVDVDELDSYVMIYRQIEAYLLAQRQNARLELARRCLYFKINRPLSRAPGRGKKSWQRQLLERLTREWGWTDAQLLLLDQRSRWKAAQVMEERALLVNELNHSYRSLTTFAHNCGAERTITAREVTVLGRKLQAAFERRPGKITWINPGISGDLSEPLLVLKEITTDEGTLWQLTGPPPADARPLRQSANLAELLFWCHYNGLVQPHTQFDLSRTRLNPALPQRLLACLQRWHPADTPSPAHAVFQTSAAPSDVLLLINVGSEAQAHLHEQGIHRASNRTDALGYSGFHDNLITSVDFITRNSWGEISCQHFEGQKALLHTLEAYLSLSLPGRRQPPPQLSVECAGFNHDKVISQRVSEWLEDICACYSGRADEAAPAADSVSTRYLFTMAGDYYSLQFDGSRLNINHHRAEADLIRWLGQPQSRYSPFALDKRASTRHPLRLIAAHAVPDAVDVFYHSDKSGLRIYLVDERGSLLTFTGHQYALAPLARFLRAVLDRQARACSDGEGLPHSTPVRFFELTWDRQQAPACEQATVLPHARTGYLLDVKAAVSCDISGRYAYSFYCDQKEFSQLEHGARLFDITADYVRTHRQTQQNYAVHLSDLDLDLCRQQLASDGRLQTVHYLRLKLELEHSLNQALPKPRP